MCICVEIDVFWRRCSVLCRMYERGKEVVREWLWQSGLSRALSLDFKLLSAHATVRLEQTRIWERRRVGRLCTRQGLPPPSLTRNGVVSHPPPCHPSACGLSDPPPPCHWGPCVFRAAHLHRCWGCNSLTQRGLGTSVVLEGPCVLLSAWKVHVGKVLRSRAIHYRCYFVWLPVHLFCCCLVSTQIARQLHQERTQEVWSNREAWKRPARRHFRNGPCRQTKEK